MKRCEISGKELTPGKVQTLVSDRELEHLVVWGGPVSNDDLAFLGQCTSLRGLTLGEMRIDDGVFRHLCSLASLEELNLAYTAVTGDFATLAELPLRDVRLEGCRFVGDAAAGSLAKFPTLRQLEVHMTGLTDAGVSALALLPLEVLWLGPRVTDGAMAVLGEMPTLQHLDICAHNVSDAGIPFLVNLPNLTVLWLTRCTLTDACIPALSALTALHELNVNDTGVSEAGVAQLRAALPGCHFPPPD